MNTYIEHVQPSPILTMRALSYLSTALLLLGAVFDGLACVTLAEPIRESFAHLQLPLSLIPALFYWQWPEPLIWLWLIGLAGAGTLGHLMYTRAIQLAEGASAGGEWNRGAYLSLAVSHCGECHTPRNFLGGLDKSRWFIGAAEGEGPANMGS